MRTTFRFVGEIVKTDGLVKEITSQKSDWKGKKLSLLLKNNKGTQFVEIFGGEPKDKINVFSKERDDKGKLIRLEIPKNRRLEKDVLDMISDMSKIKIFDQEFITEYDAIEYIESNIDTLNGMKVYVYGDVNFREYNNKVSYSFSVKEIREAKEDDIEDFFGNLPVIITPKSTEEKDVDKIVEIIKANKSYQFSCYVPTWSKEGTVYLPQLVEIAPSSQFDFENQQQLLRLKTLIGYFINRFNDAGVLVKIDKPVELGFMVRFVNGAEERELTLNDLNPFQRQNVEAGIESLESIAKEISVKGEYRQSIQIIKPQIRFYPNGHLDIGITMTDLMTKNEGKTETERKNEIINNIELKDEVLF